MKDNASFELDGKTFTAEEIIKAIYREVIFVYAKERGENEIPDFTIDGIVLTHPAGFEMPEVNTLCSAAKQCGCAEGKKLNVIGTIKEPVAAALSYYDANKNLPDGTGILVYDLGGGTCDIALVRKKKEEIQEYEVVDSDMIRVGGKDWDDIIYDYISNVVKNQSKNSDYMLNENASNMFVLVNASKNIKERLTESSTVKEIIDLFPSDDLSTKESFKIEITRTDFDDLSQTLRNQTINKLETMYQKHCKDVDISEVILVGGASVMPQIKEGIEERLIEVLNADIVVRSHEEAYAISRGAAIYADKVMERLKEKYSEDEIKSLLEQKNGDEVFSKGSLANLLISDEEGKGVITDILPYSYGVRFVYQGKSYIKNLVKQGDTLPATGIYNGFNPNIDANTVIVEVYESERCDDCYILSDERLVGRVELHVPGGIKKSDKVGCEIKIFSLDEVVANATGNNQKATAEFKLNITNN